MHQYGIARLAHVIDPARPQGDSIVYNSQLRPSSHCRNSSSSQVNMVGESSSSLDVENMSCWAEYTVENITAVALDLVERITRIIYGTSTKFFHIRP